MPPKAKPVTYSATELKQWMHVLIARAGAVVQGMGKVGSEEIYQRMVEQIKIQMNLYGMIQLPEGMTWDMIIGKYLLSGKTTPQGKAEWRKWGEIRAWMHHASRWWAEALDKFGYTMDNFGFNIDQAQKGSGKNMEDVWRHWKLLAWEYDKKGSSGGDADDMQATGENFDENYETRFYRMFCETAGQSSNPLVFWEEARRLLQDCASDVEIPVSSRPPRDEKDAHLTKLSATKRLPSGKGGQTSNLSSGEISSGTKERENRDDMSEEENSSSDEEDVGHRDLTFSDLLGELSLKVFKEEYWGKKMYASAVSEETLETLREGFYGGDLGEVGETCRKGDNTKYSEEEISAFKEQLENKVTVDLSFCYSKGANQIKNAFITECQGMGNDIEVGLYFSRVGGAPAQWHFDNNHNLTIQITGEKDWLTAPGDMRTMSSRGLAEPRGNAFDNARPHPDISPQGREHFNLRPGSILYVPPGYWHSVTPNKGNSFSIDLRVANIMHARWVCEALFLELTARDAVHFSGHPSAPLSIGPRDFLQNSDLGATELSVGANTYVDATIAGVKRALEKCPMPRPLPFERQFSDGMEVGASLEYLECKLGKYIDPFVTNLKTTENFRFDVRVNPLVTLTAKKRDGTHAVLHMRSVSSLTASEYLHFSLICDGRLWSIIHMLADSQTADSHCIPILHFRTKDGLLQSDVLLGILHYANIVTIVGESEDSVEQRDAKQHDNAASVGGQKRHRS